jgi:hypothetical protein
LSLSLSLLLLLYPSTPATSAGQLEGAGEVGSRMMLT